MADYPKEERALCELLPRGAKLQEWGKDWKAHLLKLHWLRLRKSWPPQCQHLTDCAHTVLQNQENTGADRLIQPSWNGHRDGLGWGAQHESSASPEPPGRKRWENWIKMWLDSFTAQLKPSAESQTCKHVANNLKINVLCSNGFWTIYLHYACVCFSEHREVKQGGEKNIKNKDENKGLIKAKHNRMCHASWELSEGVSQCTSNSVCGVTGTGNHHNENLQSQKWLGWCENTKFLRNINKLGLLGEEKKKKKRCHVATLVPLKVP